MPKNLRIYGESHIEPYIHNRIACRALIERDRKLLVSVESDGELVLLPGGGRTKGETFAQCVIREVREESGFIVDIIEEFFIISEYYDRSMFETHYFLCRIVDCAEQSLTSSEAGNNLKPEWRDADELKSYYKQYSKDPTLPIWKQRVYLREYSAISEYLKRYQPEE